MKNLNHKKSTLEFKGLENDAQMLRFLAGKKYWWASILFALVIIGMIVFVADDAFDALVITGLVILGYFTLFAIMARRMFMEQFASANGFEYKHAISTDNVKGLLFKRGQSKRITHVVSGVYKGHDMRLFHYQYTIGGGKAKIQWKFTAAELFFEEAQFPHILLQSRNMARKSGKAPNEQELSLDREFSETFRLFAAEGYEIEVFQMFRPEVLRLLKEKSAEFSIEFVENRLYVYDDRVIADKRGLRELFEVAHAVTESMGPLLSRLHNDFAVLHPYYGAKKR